MDGACNKCYGLLLPNQWMKIETEKEPYYFCSTCIVQAEKTLAMKMYLNKDDRDLLKKFRKYLKKKKLYVKN